MLLTLLMVGQRGGSWEMFGDGRQLAVREEEAKEYELKSRSLSKGKFSA